MSDSCNQRVANNVNNGEPKTNGKPATGTLLIKKLCFECHGAEFDITVTGNNPQPSTFTLSNGQSQTVTFTVSEAPSFGFRSPGFAGDCKITAVGSQQATGTITAEQHLTCTIINDSNSPPP